MRVKTKGFLMGVVFLVLIALLILYAVFIDNPTMASADTTPTQTAVFSYTYHIDNADHDLSENNVRASREVRSSDDGKKCEVSFSLNTTCITRTNEEIYTNNVGSNSLRIRAASNFNIVSFEVKNRYEETI